MDRKTEILQHYWKYESFRPLQGEIIDSVLKGKDTLALLPTGGGKSICFQIPALAKEGICIVVSPLIALMKDQVGNLKKRGIKADAIYSGMHIRDIDRILDNAAYGDTKLLYLSPERLMTDLLRERVMKMNVNLLAVDEAHCISQWGYDFRPPYLEIAEFRKLIPDVPVLAVTATATPEVVEDIQEKLEFGKKNVFRKSFNRSNLSYSVLEEANKPLKMLDILNRVNGSGVIYARNRRKTKEITQFLLKKGIGASFYHAGLSADVRSKRQEDWLNGKIRIMVATNAFGMGIDKPNVRLVIHLDLPDNLEAYFQEAGRGGRDGEKAFAVLLYNEKDKLLLERQFEQAYPEWDEVRRVWQALGSYFQLAVGSGLGLSYDFDLNQFAKNYQLEIIKAFNCLKLLEQNGWLTLSEAIHLPPSIKFIMEKEALYDYQIRNKKSDRLIRKILQTHQGGYSSIIPLRKFSELAYGLKITPVQLHTLLNHLHQEKVLEYVPAKDKPQLTFLKERVGKDDLVLDKDAYGFRKNRQKERIRKTIAYAETPTCRSQQLLSYFGETGSDKCGICDVCTGRNSSKFSADEFERLQNKIINLLKRENLTPKEVLDSFAPKYEKRLLIVLDYLYKEEIVGRNKEGRLVLEKK